MSKQENQKRLRDVLKELKDSIADCARARMAYEYVKAKENVKEGVKDFREHCENSAKQMGVDLADSAAKYDEARNNVKAIEEQYRGALEELRSDYNDRSEGVNLEITELQGEQMEYLEGMWVAEEARDKFIEENAPELKEAKKEKQKEIEECKKELAKAAKKGDLESVKEYQAKWEALSNEVADLEKGYAEKLEPYDTKIEEMQDKYEEYDSKIEELENLAEQMEADFEAECKSLKEDRETSLADVKNNKFMDKVKGFFAKNLFKGINNVKRFQRDFLEPTGKQVAAYVTTVPGKIDAAKEAFESKVQEVTGKARDAIYNARDFVIDVKDKAVDKVIDTKDKIVGAAVAVGDKIVDAKDNIVDKANDAKEWVAGKANDAKEWATDKATDAKEWVADKATDAKEAVQQFGRNAVGVAVSVGQGAAGVAYAVGQGAVNAANAVGRGAVSVADKIKGAYNKGKNAAHQMIYDARDSVAQGMENVAEKLTTRAAKLREDTKAMQDKDNDNGEID